MKKLITSLLLLTSSLCWGHARMLSPVPRDNNAGIKVGPCGNLARSATPTVVRPGQMLTIQWEETINHPGKYIFSLSQANDMGFAQNVLATVIDQQNVGVPLPHRYTTQVQLPNIECPNCTLQMIQSMEENPAAPSFYYSCADLNITAAVAPTPTPTPIETIQSSTLAPQAVEFGQGCGTVKAATSVKDLNFKWMLVCLLTMLIPVLAWARLRALATVSNRK